MRNNAFASMPEIPPKNVPEKEKIEGTGRFKATYPYREGLVRKRHDQFDSEERELRNLLTPEYIKAEFYLRKLVLLLVPHCSPKIFLASAATKTAETLEERITPNIPTSNHDRMRLHRAIKDFVAIDTADQNYGYAKNGSVMYIDSFEPWQDVRIQAGRRKLERLYNENAIRNAIHETLHDAEKNRALRYLNRINILYTIANTAFLAKQKTSP